MCLISSPSFGFGHFTAVSSTSRPGLEKEEVLYEHGVNEAIAQSLKGHLFMAFPDFCSGRRARAATKP